MVRIGEPCREYIREPAPATVEPGPGEPLEEPLGDPADPATPERSPEREPEKVPTGPSRKEDHE